MTKNLNLAGGTTITPADSNVTSNYTLPMSSTTGFSDDNTGYVYNSGSTSCSTSSPCYSYYSFVAASAGTGGTSVSSGNVSSDICPKGWRLPTDTEFNELKTLYTTGVTLNTTPWSGVYTGHYNSGSSNYLGQYAYYWSSTIYSSTLAYNIMYSSSSSTVDHYFKKNGFPVRCVYAATM